MTYRERLVQKLIDNGARAQQVKQSKLIDIMIKTLALESNPDLDEFVKIVEEDKKQCEKKKWELKQREFDIENRERELAANKRMYRTRLEQMQAEEKSLQALRDQIDECETAEAKDRIRLADRFTATIDRSGGITNGYERTAYIKSLGMILGTKCQNEEDES